MAAERVADWCQDMLYCARKADKLNASVAELDPAISAALARIAAFCLAECAKLLTLLSGGDNNEAVAVAGDEAESAELPLAEETHVSGDEARLDKSTFRRRRRRKSKYQGAGGGGEALCVPPASGTASQRPGWSGISEPTLVSSLSSATSAGLHISKAMIW